MLDSNENMVAGSEKKVSENGEELVRLQVFLAHSGVASRRASEKIILDGRVSVNGVVCRELGTKVSPKDEILVDGNKISVETQMRYVLLNKPEGYVCSSSDEKGRPIATDLLKDKYSERLYNVGRLDMFSSGLIIFTNDGQFAKTLSHPSSCLEKEYIVDSSVPLPRDLASNFEKGVRVDGVFYKCLKAEDMNARRMRVVLIEGKNREIRNVFASRDIGIKRLVRVRIGSVQMNGLKSGESRDLTSEEVKSLLALCNKNQ